MLAGSVQGTHLIEHWLKTKQWNDFKWTPMCTCYCSVHVSRMECCLCLLENNTLHHWSMSTKLNLTLACVKRVSSAMPGMRGMGPEVDCQHLITLSSCEPPPLSDTVILSRFTYSMWAYSMSLYCTLEREQVKDWNLTPQIDAINY